MIPKRPINTLLTSVNLDSSDSATNKTKGWYNMRFSAFAFCVVVCIIYPEIRYINFDHACELKHYKRVHFSYSVSHETKCLHDTIFASRSRSRVSKCQRKF